MMPSVSPQNVLIDCAMFAATWSRPRMPLSPVSCDGTLTSDDSTDCTGDSGQETLSLGCERQRPRRGRLQPRRVSTVSECGLAVTADCHSEPRSLAKLELAPPKPKIACFV